MQLCADLDTGAQCTQCTLNVISTHTRLASECNHSQLELLAKNRLRVDVVAIVLPIPDERGRNDDAQSDKRQKTGGDPQRNGEGEAGSGEPGLNLASCGSGGLVIWRTDPIKARGRPGAAVGAVASRLVLPDACGPGCAPPCPVPMPTRWMNRIPRIFCFRDRSSPAAIDESASYLPPSTVRGQLRLVSTAAPRAAASQICPAQAASSTCQSLAHLTSSGLQPTDRSI